jgi:MFS family permease
MRLWAAQAISAFGSRITRTGLPIIGIAMLDVPETAIGLLAALQYAPGVVVAMAAGGFVDRAGKRRILIAADLVRAVLVASIAIAWWTDVLTIAHVIAVGAGVGMASALFEITDNAYLPALIGPSHLLEGNTKLESTQAVAEIGGPPLAGILIRAIGAPLAMLVDAASYLWSAAVLATIGARETPSPHAAASASSIRGDLAIGMRAIFGQPHVRAVVLAHAVWAASGGFFMTLYALYCLRVLELDAATYGSIIGVGGIGALIGAAIARPLARRLGVGGAMLLAAALSLSCALFIPLARGPIGVVVGCLVAHQLLSDAFATVFLIHGATLRQTVLPQDVLGRAAAAYHACTAGIMPIAALIAGGLAYWIDIRTAVWIGVLLGLAAPLFLWPIRGMRELPIQPAPTGRTM